MSLLSKIITFSLALSSCSFISSASENVNNLATISQTAKTTNTTKTITASQLAPYTKRDITDEVFYFVLPDRFYNGDSSNDLGAKANDKKRAQSRGGFDKSNKGMFHGGDLLGLTEKLPYLHNMGISAIWLTPILRNKAVQANSAGYHGYWILDFSEIDPHFGNSDDLKNFIAKAHQLNIKVFFDIITNHTADVIKYKECHGDDGLGWLITTPNSGCPYLSTQALAQGKHYTPIIPKGDEKVKTPAWLNDPKYYHNQGDSTWQGESSQNGDFAGLDDIKTEDPFVVKGFINIYKNIIKTFKPDGFRIDTVKHVNLSFWSQFSPTLIEYAKQQGINNFFMFGEVYSADPQFLSRYTTKGNIPSVLDFGLQKALVDTLIKQQGTHKLTQLFAQDPIYNDNDSNANELINFIGNHDMGRFAYMLKQDKHHYNEQQILARVKLASAMMFFARGVPVIYYGDEQGFVGDGVDQDSRQDMMPSKVASYNDDDLLATNKTTADDNFDPNHQLYKFYQQLAYLYHSSKALRNGKQHILYSQQQAGIFAFERQLNNESVLVLLNTANTQQVVNIDFKRANISTTGYKKFTANKAVGENLQQQLNKKMTIPALSFTVYRKITH